MTILAADRPSVATVQRPARRGRSPLELFAAAIALLLPVAFATGVDANTWSVRAAILIVVAGVGLPLLLSQTRGPRPLAARAAVGFLACGLASAVLSHNHTTAVFGIYNEGTGLLFMAGVAGAWAIGRSLRAEARPMLERCLLCGIFINLGFALLASMVDMGSVGLNLVDGAGRASGLTGNPVHLAALAVLGLALVVPRFVMAPVIWAVPVATLAAAVQLSGARGALVVMAGIGLWAGRRHGVRIAAMLALLLFVGLAGATMMGSSSHVSATARAGNLDDWHNRPLTWLSARHSVAEHPLLGIGPGQFRTATSPYRLDAVARSEGPDRLATDAHNIFIEYLTTTGLLGLGALVVWLFAATRPARGWLLVGALGVLVIHLFEPQSVVTTPLAFLALGASGPFVARLEPPPRPRHWLIALCCTGLAFAAASAFLAGEFQAARAKFDLAVAPAQQANRLLPPWPATASILAKVWLFHGITNGHNQADYQTSRSWRLAAVQRDDTDPALWNDLGELDESLGHRQDAQAEYLSALRLNPTSLRAMDGLARFAHAQCDPNQEQHWRQRALAVTPAPLRAPAVSQPAPAKCVSLGSA